MLPVRCYCQARHLYGSGAVPSSRVRRPPASVSPGQLAQWADPQVSSKDNQIWLSGPRPKNLLLKQIQQVMCVQPQCEKGVRGRGENSIF